jgi:hypothetical protein
MNKQCFLLSAALLAGFCNLLNGADIYVLARIANTSSPFNEFQFGKFDLDNPNTSGGSGNYVYSYSAIGTKGTTALKNLAFNPTNSTMYLSYGTNEYRTIDTSGTLSASSLGTTASLFGMAFNESGELYGAHTTNMYDMNPATGATLSTATLTTMAYSSYGGNMTWMSGSYYFANEYNKSLVILGTNGSYTSVGKFVDTDYTSSAGHALFMHENQMYLLNGLNLFSVNAATAALTKLGSITGIGGTGISKGFSGAISFTPVPEPSTYAMGLAGMTLIALGARRKRVTAA